jgi:predicted DNA-binding transcriptional regulator AlpA
MPTQSIAPNRAVLTPRAAALDTLPCGARLDVHDLKSLLGCGKSTLMRRVADGVAPAPLADERQLAWRAGDVRAWLNGEVVTA